MSDFQEKNFWELKKKKNSEDIGAHTLIFFFCLEPCERKCEKGANLYENWKRLGRVCEVEFVRLVSERVLCYQN